jgi:protease I
MHGLVGQHGYKIEADAPIRELNAEEYDLLILPDGGAAERLRLRNESVDVARTMIENGRWVAAIGHGPQVLISAGVLDGKTVTCSPGIRDDVRAAGALYRDDSTILDGGLLTCRGADDLPEFCRRLVALLKSPTTARVA